MAVVVAGLLASVLGGCFSWVEAGTRPRAEDLLVASRPAAAKTATPPDAGQAVALVRVQSAVGAAGSASARLDLTSAVALALRRPAGVLETEEQLTRAHIELIRSYADLLPRVRYSYQATAQEADVPALSTGERPDELRRLRHTSRFDIEQPVFRGLTPWFRIQRAHLDRERSAHVVRAARLRVVQAVLQRFFGALEADLERAHRASEAALWTALAEERTASGTLSWLARSRARSARVDAARAEAAGREARTRLALVVGQVVPQNLEPPSFRLTDLGRALADASPAALLEAAARLRPDLEVARREADVLAAEERMAWGGVLPAASLRGTWFHQRDGLRRRTDWEVGLEFSAGVFEGWSGSSALARAVSRAREGRFALRGKVQAAAEEVVRAAHTYRAASAAVAMLEADARALPRGAPPEARGELRAHLALAALRRERRLLELALAVGEDPTAR